MVTKGATMAVIHVIDYMCCTLNHNDKFCQNNNLCEKRSSFGENFLK